MSSIAAMWVKLSLIDFESTKITLYETELLRGSVFPQFTDMSISDKTDNSAKATTTVETSAHFNFIFPVSQHGICISEYPLPTTNNSIWHNTLGALPAIWSVAPVVSAELKNLKAGTTYYVCPYFVNWFGEFYGNVASFSLEGYDACETCPWVLINGVKWATRNVGASKPEDYGGYYQWNSPTTNFLLYNDYYNSNYPKSTTWLPSNDPSPSGFRVPTLAEIQSLTNSTYVKYEWTTHNGVSGGRFTDRATGNCIFLPAAGYRFSNVGVHAGSGGFYWSSTRYDSHDAYGLRFVSGYADWDYGGDSHYKSTGLPVRPVAE